MSDIFSRRKKNIVSVFRNRVQTHLSNQLLLIILPTTFILIGLGAWLVHGFVADRINVVTENSLIDAADTIEDVLQHALMTNDAEMIQQTVFDIGIQRQANSVRVISRNGIVVASSIPDEIWVHLKAYREPGRRPDSVVSRSSCGLWTSPAL